MLIPVVVPLLVSISIMAEGVVKGYDLITGNVNWICIILICLFYFYYLARSKKDPKKYARIVKGKFIMTIFLAAMIGTNLENLFLDRWKYIYFPRLVDKINFTEDIFSIILSVYIIVVARKQTEQYRALAIENLLQQRMNEFQIANSVEAAGKNKADAEQIKEFCQYYKLTERETEVLQLTLRGMSNKDISEELYITVGTVKTHLHSIFQKLEVSSRSQLMVMFINHKIGD